MRGYLARLIGLALEGQVTEHLLPIHCGERRERQVTFIDACIAALGDYAAPADPDLLTARTFDAHPTGVADLFGLRLAVLHETDKGSRAGRGHRQAADRRGPDQGPADARGLLVVRSRRTRS